MIFINYIIQFKKPDFKEYKRIHDFSEHLLNTIDYQKWYNEYHLNRFTDCDYFFKDSLKDFKVENPSEFIPVGDLNFVYDYVNINYETKKENFKPLNIPTALNKEKLTKRKTEIVKIENPFQTIGDFECVKQLSNNFNKDVFIKSNTQYKKYVNIINPFEIIPVDEYFISEKINIVSEYRCFVYDDHIQSKLLDIKNYSGDFSVFPSIEFVELCLHEYKEDVNRPKAYTIDIGIDDLGNNFIIEVHPFVSCGLYGFSDYNYMRAMVKGGYEWFKNEAIKNKEAVK